MRVSLSLALFCHIGSITRLCDALIREPSARSSAGVVVNRRAMLHQVAAIGGGASTGGGLFGSIFGNNDSNVPNANAAGKPPRSKGPTNEIVKVVNGMKYRRLGGSDILVSELGLGAQRWVSTDFNAPTKDLCYEFMDEAILKRGVNLIDTAEQVNAIEFDSRCFPFVRISCFIFN